MNIAPWKCCCPFSCLVSSRLVSSRSIRPVSFRAILAGARARVRSLTFSLSLSLSRRLSRRTRLYTCIYWSQTQRARSTTLLFFSPLLAHPPSPASSPLVSDCDSGLHVGWTFARSWKRKKKIIIIRLVTSARRRLRRFSRRRSLSSSLSLAVDPRLFRRDDYGARIPRIVIARCNDDRPPSLPARRKQSGAASSALCQNRSWREWAAHGRGSTAP